MSSLRGRLHPTTPEIWYKIQRPKAQTEPEMDKLTAIFEKWRAVELMVKLPFTIQLTHDQHLNRSVYFTGYKTDGEHLFVEYQITIKGPKLVQQV